jgi:DNA invertase Pin-like site-specific DNA recombinase
MKAIIGYRRVSTDRQGRSGLGLEAQDSALQAYSSQTGGPILKTYTEIETGKRSDRPELTKALAHAKRARAQLVVAKLDRLARNVAFVSALLDAGCDFVCCDMPHANRLTIHILAAVAEAEAKAISDRTKSALAAYKARGGSLGAKPGHCPIPIEARQRGGKRAAQTLARLADDAAADLAFIVEWRKSGMTQQQIADRLRDEGFLLRRGGTAWTQGHVRRLLLRRFQK